MRLKGTLFERRGVWGSKVEGHFDCEWTVEAVRKAFGDAPALEKTDQQLWSATRYRPDSNRGWAGLLGVTAAVLDFDCCDVGDMDLVCDAVQAQGLAFVLYTSWSHASPSKVHDDTQIIGPFDCFRLVLPYDREVTPAEHTSLVDALFGFEIPDYSDKYRAEALGRVVVLPSSKERMAKPRGWDPTSNQPTRGYFIPAFLDDSILEVHPGRPLPVETVLARPTTARPAARKLRPYLAPAPSAVGALGVLERALDKLGLSLGREGAAGWRRSSCPSCQDASPSLTVRANGDGVDVRCHAGCKRQDVLAALDLFGPLWAPPSWLQIDLEHQLEAQRPATDAIDANLAGQNLGRDLLEAVSTGKRVVLKSPAGTGKSYQSAWAMSELARRGERICYATQEHAVAHETRSKLSPDIRARSVHVHSPLIQVGDDPVCQRAAELKERVFEFGVSLMGNICPRCPFRDSCEALAAARERTQALTDASVVFVSHAGIRQVFGVDSEGRQKGLGMKLIVDEMTSVFERIEVSAFQLNMLAKGAMLPSCSAAVGKVVQEVARAVLAQEEPGVVGYGPGNELGSAGELAVEWGRVLLRDGAHPQPNERIVLEAADNLLRLYAHHANGGGVEGLDDPSADGIAAMLPDACHQALVERNGVLLSATPLMAALGEFELKEQVVSDGAPVRRVMVLRAGRGSKALLENYYDDELGMRQRRDKEPGEEYGIPWPEVDQALARALHEADRYGADAKVLFVTFKGLADILREDQDRLAGGRIKVAHYGALRGKNDWEEGRPDACKVCYCFGTPRFNLFPVFAYLQLVGDAASDAWRDYAAGELTQAEGRLRLPRRKTPCTIVVEGDVAPSSWYTDNVDQVIADADHYETASGLLEAALAWRRLDDVAALLGVDDRTVRRWRQPGRPPPGPEHMPTLRQLARPPTAEAMRLLAKLPAGRRQRLDQEFSWAPLLDAE